MFCKLAWKRMKREVVRFATLALALLVATNAIAADEPAKGKAKVKAKADQPLPPELDWVPRGAVAYAAVCPSDLLRSEKGRLLLSIDSKLGSNVVRNISEIQRAAGVDLRMVERLVVVMLHLPPREQSFCFIVALTEPVDQERYLGKLSFKVTPQRHRDATFYRSADEKTALHFASNRVVVMGTEDAVKEVLDASIQKKAGPLDRPLRLSTGRYFLVAGFNPTPIASVVGKIDSPQTAKFLPLLKALYGIVFVQLFEESRLEARLIFPNAAGAQAGKDALEPMFSSLKTIFSQYVTTLGKESKNRVKMNELLREAEKGLNKAIIEERGTGLRLIGYMKTDLSSLRAVAAEISPIVSTTTVGGPVRVEPTAQMLLSRDVIKLRQIAQAMHRSQDQGPHHLPPAAVRGKNGKPFLSWRVMLLPHLGEEKLFNEFRKDEPWDSEHNKKLLARMPAVYAMQGRKVKDPQSTYFQVILGDGAFGAEKPPVIPQSFGDGTSNTIMVVEAHEAVPWTKPEDVTYLSTKPLPVFGDPKRDYFLAALADARSVVISRKNDEKVIRAAITPNNKDWIDPYWLTKDITP